MIDVMFSNKVKEPFDWVKYKVLYLPLLDKYVGENFYWWNNGYYLHKGSFIDGVVRSYGLTGIDADDLVGQITEWFCEALDKYNFEEVIRELDFTREAFVYAELKTYLHRHCRYLKVRHRIIPHNKSHKVVRYLEGYCEDTRCQIDLSGLAPVERLVIDGFYFENLTLKQISAIIDRSESSVKRIKTQALNKLSEFMN